MNNLKLKQEVVETKAKIKSLNEHLHKIYAECTHKFKSGYYADDLIIYCSICDREADDIYPGMSYKHAQKLID